MFYIGLFLIIGAIHGVVSYIITKDRGMPRSLSVVIGAVGAIIGGIIATTLRTASSDNLLADILISSTGAIVFLFTGNLLEMAFGPQKIDGKSHHQA